MKMIGILALQGGFKEHEDILDELALKHKRLRSLDDVEGLTGLIIPGGESTVMKMFMKTYGLDEWLKRRSTDENFQIYGTCAGMILLADLGLLDATVERNAYGRQLDSFVVDVDVSDVGQVSGHFIRAPKIVNMESAVEVLAEHKGVPVLVRQGNIWASSFHPELAGDSRIHASIWSS
jgi:5'-phosphate synthase pdxT subunit